MSTAQTTEDEEGSLLPLSRVFNSPASKIFGSQIDISTNLLRAFIQMRISAIKSYDDYMHSMMEDYGKLLSQFYTTCKK